MEPISSEVNKHDTVRKDTDVDTDTDVKTNGCEQTEDNQRNMDDQVEVLKQMEVVDEVNKVVDEVDKVVEVTVEVVGKVEGFNGEVKEVMEIGSDMDSEANNDINSPEIINDIRNTEENEGEDSLPRAK